MSIARAFLWLTGTSSLFKPVSERPSGVVHPHPAGHLLTLIMSFGTEQLRLGAVAYDPALRSNRNF